MGQAIKVVGSSIYFICITFNNLLLTVQFQELFVTSWDSMILWLSGVQAGLVVGAIYKLTGKARMYIPAYTRTNQARQYRIDAKHCAALLTIMKMHQLVH